VRKNKKEPLDQDQVPTDTLSDKLRRKAQRAALFYNLFGQTINFIVVGQYLQLYASDVLGFEPSRIAAIIGVIPLVAFLRFFILDWVRKFGRARLLGATAVVRMGVLVFMILIPPAWMSFGVLLGLLLIFTVAQQFGAGTVWGSLMRDITTDSDRGQFFSRMRFSFTAVNAITLFIFSLVISNEMTDAAYKALLLVAAVGQVNTLIWSFKIPDQDEQDAGSGRKSMGGYKRFIITLRTSPLLRLPLVISILMQLSALPLIAVYLRTMLGVPAQLVSFFLLSSTIGSAISFLIWGKIADTLGFRPMLSGLLLLSIAVAPGYLLLAPFDPTRSFALLNMNLPEAVTALTLIFLGFVNGALASGMGIATTTVEQHHVRRRDALESLNIYGVIVGLIAAGVTLFSGFYLESFALPLGIKAFGNGVFHIDWVKVWIVVAVPLFKFGIMILVRRLPNTHPNFEMDDFFGTLRNNPVRTLFAQRRLYSEDESRRMGLARWLGQSDNPLSIQSLIEMTTDPSYDVKTEAIRSLGLSGSKAAGAALLEILKDPDRVHLVDHVAWALGELKYRPAVPSIRAGLARDYPNRIRAMAARALGRIGDPEAIPDLVKSLDDPEASLHIKSSCLRALVALNARDHAREIFIGIDQLGTRNERFELVAACGEWMRTPIEWVLRANTRTTLTEAIAIQAEEMPDVWLRTRGPLLEELVAHDRNALFRAFDTEIAFRPDADRDLFETLGSVIKDSEKWGPTSALAAGIVLFAPIRKPS
jgi:predicted MFS family arabinose efflux permease